MVLSVSLKGPSDSGSRTVKAKTHKVRNSSASMLFRKNFAVHQVLRAGMWASQTMFTTFYLRDVACSSMDTFAIGPVVATQQVMLLQTHSCVSCGNFHFTLISWCSAVIGSAGCSVVLLSVLLYSLLWTLG